MVLLFCACKKKDPISTFCDENPDDCVDVREVKDYFYFEVGSYWVYEEENTGMRDSVYVTETNSDPETVIFSTRLFSTYDEYFYRYYTTGAGYDVDNIAKKSDISTRVHRSKGKPGEYIATDPCFLFYPTVGSWTYNYGGSKTTEDTLIVANLFKEYNLKTFVFSDVVCMRKRYTAIENLQPTLHYYSPNIGLIRKELIDSNQIWNLVDYKIVK